MTEEFTPIWKELAIPVEEERRLYEQWREQQEKDQDTKEEDGHVLVIDI